MLTTRHPAALALWSRPAHSTLPKGLDPEDDAANPRLTNMWQEATSFQDELVRLQNALLDFETATVDFLSTVEPLSRAPLPRVWDAVDGGLAEPLRATISHAHPNTVGGDASIAVIKEATEDFQELMDNDILHPLDQWRSNLRSVQERLPELDQLRAEVGRRAGELRQLRNKVEHKLGAGRRYTPQHRTRRSTGGDDTTTSRAIVPASRHAGHPGGSSGKGVRGLLTACIHPRHGVRGEESDEDEVFGEQRGGLRDPEMRWELQEESAEMEVSSRQRKLDVARQQYIDNEEQAAGQLSGLVRDSAWMKSYVVASLLLAKDAMQVAVVGLGVTKQPLPSFWEERCAPVRQHGDMADNVVLAAAMTEALASRVRKPLPSTTLAPRALAVHKVDAQPLELYAVPEAAPLDQVPPAPTGATHLKASAVEGLARVAGGLEPAGAGWQGEGGTTGGGFGATDTAVQRDQDRAGRVGGAEVYAASDLARPQTLGQPSMGTAAPRSFHAHKPAAATLETAEEEVVGRTSFTEVEDRPVVKERVVRYMVHQPVEKVYMQETRFVGEREAAGSPGAALVSSEVREVAGSLPAAAYTRQEQAEAAGRLEGAGQQVLV